MLLLKSRWTLSSVGQSIRLITERSMVRVHQGPPLNAGMAELADALDLGSSAARLAGSTPVTRTIRY